MPDPTTLVLLALAAVAAGFVDAVVGGGGLIQLPALVLGLTGASPVQVLATNKLGSICGTSVSSVTYYRRVRPHAGTFVPLMLFAFVGSFGGALLASQIPKDAFQPVVLAVLVAVGAYVLFTPELGVATDLRFGGHLHTAAAMAAGLVVGAYDGALGPGTGSFFVFSLVGLLGYAFLEASAKARMANWATNLAALCVRAAGCGALAGRPGHGRLQPGRRLPRRADRGVAWGPVRTGLLHRRDRRVRRPDRRWPRRPVVSDARTTPGQ